MEPNRTARSVPESGDLAFHELLCFSDENMPQVTCLKPHGAALQ